MMMMMMMMMVFAFSPSSGWQLRGDEEEQRRLAAGLTQMSELNVDDEGSRVDDDQRLMDGDDTLGAQRIATWLAKHQQRETKKWNYFDELHHRDAKDFDSQYNVLDQIGSNIIRRK